MNLFKRVGKKLAAGAKTVTGYRAAKAGVSRYKQGKRTRAASKKAEEEFLNTPDPELEELKKEAAAQAAMPSIDSAAVEEARKKAALLAAARGGRASTMLSDKGY